MHGDGATAGAGPSRRAVVTGGLLLAALAAGAETVLVATAGSRVQTPVVVAPPAPAPLPALPPLAGPPTAGIELRLAAPSSMQCFVPVPETGEWFATQATGGTSGLVDPAGLAVGDIVVSRLAPDGSLIDAMTLPDSGHGMGLVVRMEAGVRVLYSCWFAAGASGHLYDVVRIPYAAGTASRAAAATVVPGAGYPLDPFVDPTTQAVTVRHQGGGGPEYTRHRWTDFAAGDLSRPTGSVATTDRPPTHQGFASLGDRFFFYSGAPSTQLGGDPPLITEYDWRTGRVVGAPLDAAGNTRQPDGTYPGGSMEPEGATIAVDGGAASLLVGVTTGGGPRGGKVDRTFRYPLAATSA